MAENLTIRMAIPLGGTTSSIELSGSIEEIEKNLKEAERIVLDATIRWGTTLDEEFYQRLRAQKKSPE